MLQSIVPKAVVLQTEKEEPIGFVLLQFADHAPTGFCVFIIAPFKTELLDVPITQALVARKDLGESAVTLSVNEQLTLRIYSEGMPELVLEIQPDGKGAWHETAPGTWRGRAEIADMAAYRNSPRLPNRGAPTFFPPKSDKDLFLSNFARIFRDKWWVMLTGLVVGIVSGIICTRLDGDPIGESGPLSIFGAILLLMMVNVTFGIIAHSRCRRERHDLQLTFTDHVMFNVLVLGGGIALISILCGIFAGLLRVIGFFRGV